MSSFSPLTITSMLSKDLNLLDVLWIFTFSKPLYRTARPPPPLFFLGADIILYPKSSISDNLAWSSSLSQLSCNRHMSQLSSCKYSITSTVLLPLGRKAEGALLWACPSVHRHFRFLAVQGAFLQQLSAFLICRLVITLFCGSFNDLKNISFLRSKPTKLGKENMLF